MAYRIVTYICAMRLILLVIMVLLTSCKTSRNVSSNNVYAREHTHTCVDSIVSSVSENKSIKVLDNVDVYLDIERTEYDTSITDSSGVHPVKAKTNIKARKKKETEMEEDVKMDSTSNSRAYSYVSENDSTANDMQREVNTSVAQGVNYGLVLGVALAVMFFMIKLFRR